MDMEVYLRFVLAFVLVIGLILLGGGLLRRFAGRFTGLVPARKGQRRLKIVETLTLDPRRRLVLVRRDGVEHLLMIGGTTDIVVERGTASPAADQDAAPQNTAPQDTAQPGVSP